MNSMIGKVVEESQRDWDRRLPEVMQAYRSTIHSSTGFTPNFLVLGMETRAPVDLMLAVGNDEPEGVGTSHDEFVNEILERKRRAFDMVRQHLGRAAERRKRYYDTMVNAKAFKKGCWVWYYYPRRYQGRSPKWARSYIGPYLVVEERSPWNVVIQKNSRSKKFVTHVDKLKEFCGEPPASWIKDDGNNPVITGAMPDRESEPTGQPEAEREVSNELPTEQPAEPSRTIRPNRQQTYRRRRAYSPPAPRELRDRGRLKPRDRLIEH